jgi:hypothetical protein
MARKRTTNTTQSQDHMLEHLAYLVIHQNRPACGRDFQNFVIDDRVYSFRQGTIRNNLSRLRRLGLIELCYRSTQAYYTLPGQTDTKTNMMTLRPARVYKQDLAAMIERIVFDIPAVHDIHLRFESPMIWQTVSSLASAPVLQLFRRRSKTHTGAVDASNVSVANTSAPLSIMPVSKDLVLPELTLESGIKGRVTIHKSDTVSVILSCSQSPIRFDIGGLVRLSSSAARIEEKLLILIDLAQGQILRRPSLDPFYAANPATTTAIQPTAQPIENTCTNMKKKLHIPEYDRWIVTMWHIGRDSLERYTGEKFEVAWVDFTGEWNRVYSKAMMIGKSHANKKGKKKSTTKNYVVRVEQQEYPNERLHRAVEQKLSLLWTATPPSSYDA